jgi:hypothetical protein
MTLLIGSLALALVAFFVIFVLKRIFSLVFRGTRGTENTAEKPIHDEVLDVAEDVAAASRITAAIAGAAAFFIAPVGLMAIGASFGFIPVPLIVTLLPVILVFAVAAAAISASAKLYAKKKRKKPSKV